MADKPTGVPKKRNRIPLSCESCRIRKLKCDRQKPCLNCMSRDISCVFANGGTPLTRKRQSSNQNEDLRSKLQRLEDLVSVMAESSGGPSDHVMIQQETPPTEDTRSLSSSPELEVRQGHLIDGAYGSQHFVGPTSWATLLHDIADIREHLDELPGSLNDDPSQASINRNPALLGGVSADITIHDLVEGLPSRPLADRLVSRFFDDYDPAVPSRQMIHKPTFLRDYENFWLTKENGFCPYLLGVIYGVFCLALQSYYRQDDEPSDLRGRSFELADLYRKRAAQCALKSDITVTNRRSIECILLCSICEYARLSEGFIGQWLMLGVLVRKAMHMGFHRDPDEFTNLSPFEKEMRRRLWAHIWQIDMLFSFQLGLPNALHMFKANVVPPINVYEEELTEDMKALPPARPTSEHTPIGFTIVKLRLMKALGAVVEHLNLMNGSNSDQLSELNHRLKEAHDLIPDHLRIQPMEKSFATPRSVRLQRLQLQMFYDKASCMLNRGFIATATMKSSACMKPRTLCVESALSLLNIQQSFELEQSRWWLFYLMKHDFLLAATILYLVVFTKKKERQQELNPLAGTTNAALDEEEERILEALDKSRKSWERLLNQSREAHQACRLFDSMQRQLQTMDAETKMLQPSIAPSNRIPMDSNMMGDLKLEDTTPHVGLVGLEHFAAMDQIPEFDWGSWETSVLPQPDTIDSYWPV